VELTLATWNLERPWQSPAGIRARRLGQQIAEVAADVWVLTETATTFHVPGSTAHWSSIETLPPGYASSERAVAVHVRSNWRSELVEASQLCVAVSVSPPGARSVLVVGHLIPYRDAHDGPRWQKHLQELSAATDRWRAWRSHSRFPNHRMLVAGDLNMTLHDGPGYGTDLGRRMLWQAAQACALRCVTDIDIRAQVMPGIARDNVDHILVDENVANRGAPAFWSGRAEDGPMSDHNGVAVTVTL
jgi:endonuclease/exonuclease/phosphatase family metal-dependent hydrolase